MKWVCQNNLGSTEDIDAIGRACKEQGHDFIPMQVIPFSDELPDVSTDDPVVFYGSVRWINKIYESGRWEPGVFFNNRFDYITCRDAYGEHFLNSDCELTTLEETAKNRHGYYFVRPVADDKSFSGDVVHTLSIEKWVDKLITEDIDLHKVPVVRSVPKMITHEWRLFMVDGEAVTGSIYRLYGSLYTKDPIPGRVVHFADEVARVFSPERVFALDICLEDGCKDLKVLEVGCFNSAGFYNSDIAKIVRAVSGMDR